MERTRPFAKLVPQLNRFILFSDKLVSNFGVSVDNLDEAAFIHAFHAHNAAVKESVPADKLLVFEVKEGWQPLCDFLGVAVPDVPFPHLNSGDETIKAKLQEVFLLTKGVRNALLIVGGIVLVGLIGKMRQKV